MDQNDSRLLDRNAPFDVDEGHRPHWMQDRAITFITFRLADSLPKEVVLRWDRERLEFLRRLGIECIHWRNGLAQLEKCDRKRFNKQFHRLREMVLDRCHGSCVLRKPDYARIVADAFLHFDDDRYLMGDFVIMPNHAHCLVVFSDSTRMRRQCYSWTHFTATQINRLLGKTGHFWQEEPFDHLVRSEAQLQYLRRYIADNPLKAGLQPGEYLYGRSGRCF